MTSSLLPHIFAAQRRRLRTARAVTLIEREGSARFIFDDMADDIIERLDFMRQRTARSAIIGDVTGQLERELSAQANAFISANCLTLDEERPLPFGEMDLVASLASLDTVNDLPGALIHLRDALAPGGLMIASFVAAGSLPRLRQALLAADGERPAARFHPMIDNRGGASLMQRIGFARQVVDSRQLSVRYGSMEKLVADLRAQGLTNCLTSVPPALGKAAYRAAQQAFLAQADKDGRVTESFEILTLTGWKS